MVCGMNEVFMIWLIIWKKNPHSSRQGDKVDKKKLVPNYRNLYYFVPQK